MSGYDNSNENSPECDFEPCSVVTIIENASSDVPDSKTEINIPEIPGDMESMMDKMEDFMSDEKMMREMEMDNMMGRIRGMMNGSSEEVEQFVGSNFIDLDRVELISKFRSGYGHDYSFPSGEQCRSMKHYLWIKGGQPGKIHNPPWTTVKYYAPVNGEIVRIRKGQDRDGEIEYQFSIRSYEKPSYYFNFFHVDLLSKFVNGGEVKAGEHIGYLADEEVHGEIAVESDFNLVSFFDVITNNLFEEYKKRGITSRDDVKITKEERDKNPLTCDENTEEGRFIGATPNGLKDSQDLDNWFKLN